jgi:hypothetical protein
MTHAEQLDISTNRWPARETKRRLRIEEDDVRVALHGLGEQRAGDAGADHHHPRLPSRRLRLHHPLSRRRAVCSHRPPS